MQTSTKRKSIRTKILLSVLPVTIVAMIVSAVVLVEMAVKQIESRSEELMVQQTESYTTSIGNQLDMILEDAEVLHQNLELKAMTDEEILEYLAYTMTVNEAFPYGIYMGDKYNNYLDASWTPDADYVAYERQWYKDGIDKTVMTFGEAYVDSQTGEVCLSASCKYAARGDDDMVLSVDVTLSDISKLVAECSVMDNGYCFLVNKSDNTILAHTNAEVLGKALSELEGTSVEAVAASVLTQTGSIVELGTSEGKYLFYVEELADVGWYFISAVPKSDITSSIYHMILVAVIVMVISIAAISVIIEMVVRNTVKPITVLTDNIEKMADGDFTISIRNDSSDEIGVMSRKLAEFIEHMRKMFRQLNDVSQNLIEKSEKSSSTSTELASSANTQAASMRDLNDTVDQLSASIEEVAQNATTLVTTVSATVEKGLAANEKMTSTATTTKDGKTGMAKVAEAVTANAEQMNSLEMAVRKVGDATQEINKFVEAIGDIASQTNLLSLNASIEAARAGEAGRGFAVVADEIRNLADTSAQSVTEISAITTEIDSLVKKVVEETTVSTNQMKECNDLVKDVAGNFDAIYENVADASDIVSKMVKEIETIDDMASNMAAIAEEQASSTAIISSTSDRISQLAEKLSGNSRIVAESAESMSETSEVLAEHMKQFKLN